MPDRFDYELRALEADRRAETTLSAPMAHTWHDIAAAYRLLADFLAQEEAREDSGANRAKKHRRTPDL